MVTTYLVLYHQSEVKFAQIRLFFGSLTFFSHSARLRDIKLFFSCGFLGEIYPHRQKYLPCRLYLDIKQLYCNIATVSKQNPGQILFQCPGIPATGDFFLETFSSGLQLLVRNMNFSQPVTLYNKDNTYTIGMSFIARGKSENFSRDIGQFYLYASRGYG